MDAWRDMHPGWEYKLWTSEHGWKNQNQINAMPNFEWAGKADIIRYEILAEHGGIYVDADMECLIPFDDSFLDYESWAAFENETKWPGHLGNSVLGASPGARFFAELVQKIPTRNMRDPAWKSTGPTFITEIAKSHPELKRFPSRMFYPEHAPSGGTRAPGTEPIRARHHWASIRGYDRLLDRAPVAAPVTTRFPKIIHGIWIGPHRRPEKFMATWRDMNPTWEYRLWTNEKGWRNQSQIDRMAQFCGKADIMRYEILHEHGGIFVDADSECVRPLDEVFTSHECWACYENENVRQGLIANGYLGSVPKSPFMKDVLEAVSRVDVSQPAWISTGPQLVTRVAATHPELHVFPARTMMPHHFSGTVASGSTPVYAKQHWESIQSLRRDADGRWLDHIVVDTYRAPATEIRSYPLTSIVIPCFKQAKYLPEAMASVRAQTVRDWETVIVCGDDESMAAAARETDARTRAILRPPRGLADARNQGAELTRSRFLMGLDADDKLAPTYLEKTVAAAGDAELAIVVTALREFGYKSGTWMPGRWENNHNQIAATYCSLQTRKLWQAVGGWPVQAIGWEDWWYWMDCSRHGPKVTYLNEELLQYRIHGESMTSKDETNKRWLFAMIHLAHPSFYPASVIAADRDVMRSISPDLATRLRDRLAKFPMNHTLRTFVDMTNACPSEHVNGVPHIAVRAGRKKVVHSNVMPLPPRPSTIELPPHIAQRPKSRRR